MHQTRAQVQEANDNLHALLNAPDQEAVEKILDRIYPDTGLRSENLPARGPNGVRLHVTSRRNR